MLLLARSLLRLALFLGTAGVGVFRSCVITRSRVIYAMETRNAVRYSYGESTVFSIFSVDVYSLFPVTVLSYVKLSARDNHTCKDNILTDAICTCTK